MSPLLRMSAVLPRPLRRRVHAAWLRAQLQTLRVDLGNVEADREDLRRLSSNLIVRIDALQVQLDSIELDGRTA